MDKEFLNYEEALALKELGFDENCFGYYIQEPYYNSKKELKYRKPTYYEISGWKNSDKLISAKEDNCIYVTLPLYQQAFRWFREKYNLHFELIWDVIESELVWFCSISKIGNIDDNCIDLSYCKTHEEAELACLVALIDIVKKQNLQD